MSSSTTLPVQREDPGESSGRSPFHLGHSSIYLVKKYFLPMKHEARKRQGFVTGRQARVFGYFYCKSFHHSKSQLTFLKIKSIIHPSVRGGEDPTTGGSTGDSFAVETLMHPDCFSVEMTLRIC